MKTRQYQATNIDAVIPSWETATCLAHPFLTDEFLAQERINLAKVYMPNTDPWVIENSDSVQGLIDVIRISKI